MTPTEQSDLLAALEAAKVHDIGMWSGGIDRAISIVKEHLAKHDNLTISAAKLNNEAEQAVDSPLLTRKVIAEAIARADIDDTGADDWKNYQHTADAVLGLIEPHLRQPAPVDMKIAFTCEHTGKRWEFGNIAELAVAFLEQQAIDLEAGARALAGYSVDGWEHCEESHKVYWRQKAKLPAAAWGLTCK